MRIKNILQQPLLQRSLLLLLLGWSLITSIIIYLDDRVTFSVGLQAPSSSKPLIENDNVLIKENRECILYSDHQPISAEEAEYREFADCVRRRGGGGGGGCQPP